MEKGEQTTNNGSCLGGSAQIFLYTPYFFAKLSVMENQEDGDPCNWLPGLGKPYKYGDADGSCAQ
tara:strand:- start:351 stop:545 length:195 start_codon:yes stop_codon:yes gene_type:complete